MLVGVPVAGVRVKVPRGGKVKEGWYQALRKATRFGRARIRVRRALRAVGRSVVAIATCSGGLGVGS